MKFIRHIAFLLSLLVMMGHDIVPHVHESDYAATADHIIVPSSVIPATETALSNLLSAFEHNPSATSPAYTVQVGQKEGIAPADMILGIFSADFSYQAEWYTNLKKQRFWDIQYFSSQHSSHSFSHRGPPVA